MRRVLVALVSVLAVAVLACEAPSGTGSIEVELYEFGIETSHRSFDGGSLALSVTNVGEFPHTLVITTETGDVVTATDLIAPGTSVDLEIALQPGTYQLSCRIVAQNKTGALIDHFGEGMHAKIEGEA